MNDTLVRHHHRKSSRGRIGSVRQHQRVLSQSTAIVPKVFIPEIVEEPTESFDISPHEAASEVPRREIVANAGGNFVNQRAHDQTRFEADATGTSDGYGNVGLYDRETGGFRNLFTGSYAKAKAVAAAINSGRMRPVDGFLH